MGYPTGANVPDREEGEWGEVRVHRPNPRLSINSYQIKCPFCGEFAIRKALTSPTNNYFLKIYVEPTVTEMSQNQTHTKKKMKE